MELNIFKFVLQQQQSLGRRFFLPVKCMYSPGTTELALAATLSRLKMTITERLQSLRQGFTKVATRSPYKVSCDQSFEHAQKTIAATDFDRRYVAKIF